MLQNEVAALKATNREKLGRAMTERVSMLRGDTVYRIHWKLGTDLLVGVCYCGAEHESEDPVELWEWLLAHPDGHGEPEPVPPTPELIGASS